MQARIMQTLGDNRVVPVPRVVEYVADTGFLGSPFLVMERVEGRVPSDNPPFVMSGWVHDAPADLQRRLHDEFVSTCARIHRADWRALGLGEVASRSGGTTLAAEVAWWSDYLDWTADGAPPAALRDAAWCAENVPAGEPPPALCWGDVRIPNVVFDDDFRAHRGARLGDGVDRPARARHRLVSRHPPHDDGGDGRPSRLPRPRSRAARLRSRSSGARCTT